MPPPHHGRPRRRRGQRGVLAERLRAVRARLGLTQAAAAARLGIHPVTLAKWETGAAQPRGLARKYVEDWLARLERARNNGGDDAARPS